MGQILGRALHAGCLLSDEQLNKPAFPAGTTQVLSALPVLCLLGLHQSLRSLCTILVLYT